jgi:hypothetical protein
MFTNNKIAKRIKNIILSKSTNDREEFHTPPSSSNTLRMLSTNPNQNRSS